MISVVIPVLNEVSHLEKTVTHLRKRAGRPDDLEIIVVDSGSSDGTQELAARLKTRVVAIRPSIPGRAEALNAGAACATGDIFFFVDSDCEVPVGYDRMIFQVLGDQAVVGGAFEFTLDGSEFGLRVVEAINRTRYRIWKRYYGDQGIFVTRSAFVRSGKYPLVGLMEASRFCVALAQVGRLRLIKAPMKTSPRRFREHGIYRVLGFDIKMWWLDLWGRDVERFARNYWQDGRVPETSGLKPD